MVATPDKAVKIFYSYAQEDEHLQRELEKHLSGLERQGIISNWHNRQVVAGTDRAKVVNEHLKTASVILLLISPDFLASDYCNFEMQQALERYKLGEAHVIPVILRPADWQRTPLGHIQCLPHNLNPVIRWANLDEAFLNITEGISRAVEEVIKPRGSKLSVAPDLSTKPVKNKLLVRTDKKSSDDVEATTFQHYQDGLDLLLEQMDKKHLSEAKHLAKNLKQQLRRGGSSEKRYRILHALNEFAAENVRASFNELCRLSVTYSDMENEEHKLRDWIPYSKFRLITEQRAEEFEGRKFLFDELKEHLTVPPFSSGYIMIEGDAGIGKTAFMAALVRRYGWIHHYVNLQYGTAKPEQFLKSICAQLIIRYNLRSYSDALGDRRRSPDALLIDLLFEAVKKADEKRIVILVDALDEAAYKETGDKHRPYEDGPGLFLPPDLPGGVFIIATKRPLDDKDSSNPGALHLKPIRLDKKYHDLNMLDIRNYVESFISDEKRASVMKQRIAEWNISHSKFIGDLADKSEGNFMYIVSMLGDIFDGNITQSTIYDIRFLPAGLKSYYWFHWDRMRTKSAEEFEHLYKPIACFLAASYEPISLKSLAELSGKEPEQVQQVLNDWKQFFKISDPTTRRYQLYHASFRDFLDKVVGLKGYRDQF